MRPSTFEDIYKDVMGMYGAYLSNFGVMPSALDEEDLEDFVEARKYYELSQNESSTPITTIDNLEGW